MINVYDYLIHGIYFTLYGIVKYFPSPIGDFFRYWISKPFVKRLGKVRIYEGVTLWYPYRIEIGSHVTLNEGVYVSGYGNVHIGNSVRIGKGSTIISSEHIFSDVNTEIYKQGLSALPVHIADDVYIGASVIVRGGNYW